MRSFHQLSYHERNKIYSGLCEGKNKTAIARDLGRPLSTITREIHRNSDHIGYFYPGKAHEQAQSRRNKNKPKITKSAELRQYIIERLYDRWSPKVIAGRWNLENNGQTISKEAIYQWIYSDEGEEFGLKKLLVRARKKRGLKRKVKKAPKIKNRVSIHTRPKNINNRLEAGHYEGDLIFNSGSQSKNVCTLIDRVTKQTIMIRNESKHTNRVIDALIRYIHKEGIDIKSITFDNGSEFANHEKLNKCGIATYFCDPGSPWQKGGIEHLNGMVRRFLPFNKKASEIDSEQVRQINERVNNMPRASLGYKTPLEVVQIMESRDEACPAGNGGVFYLKKFDVAFHP